METFSEDNSQGMTQPRMKEEAGRLQRRLRNLKGLLTKDVTACIDKIRHFKTKYPDKSTEITTVEIDYAKDILETYNRCQIRFTNLEKALQQLQEVHCETWEREDDDLDEALDKLNQDQISYENKFQKITRENDEIIERCNILSAQESKTSNTGVGTSERLPKINSLRNSQIWEDLYYVHDTTIDNTIETNDNTLDILGKDVLQSLGSVHDTNILGKDVTQPPDGNSNKSRNALQSLGYNDVLEKNLAMRGYFT